jgi:hypothetical protein
MQGDIQGECLGAPATIDTPLSPAEGSTDQRIELPARNSAILLDPWDGRVSREQHLAGLLRNRYPRTKVKNLTGIVDKLRSVKCTRLGPDRSHEEYAPRPVRIPPGRGSALSGERQSSGRLPVHCGGRHGEHPERALFSQQQQTQIGRPGVDGLRSGIPLLHERHHPHVAGERQIHPGAAGTAGLRAGVTRRNNFEGRPWRYRGKNPRRSIRRHGPGFPSLEVLKAPR